MTEHLDDDTISASLDDEVTAAERAHLASCPSCSARADALGAAARAIATVAPPDPTARDAAVAAALAPHRRNLHRWGIAAAALILVLGALVPLLLTRSDGSNTTAANSTASDAERTPTAPSAGSAGASAARGTGLGPIDATTFADRVHTAVSSGTPTTVVSSACAPAVRERAGNVDTLRYTTTATVDGRPVDVLVFTEGLVLRAFAVNPDGCQDVLSPITLR